jgi:hypothetical protein
MKKNQYFLKIFLSAYFLCLDPLSIFIEKAFGVSVFNVYLFFQTQIYLNLPKFK